MRLGKILVLGNRQWISKPLTRLQPPFFIMCVLNECFVRGFVMGFNLVTTSLHMQGWVCVQWSSLISWHCEEPLGSGYISLCVLRWMLVKVPSFFCNPITRPKPLKMQKIHENWPIPNPFVHSVYQVWYFLHLKRFWIF